MWCRRQVKATALRKCVELCKKKIDVNQATLLATYYGSLEEEHRREKRIYCMRWIS